MASLARSSSALPTCISCTRRLASVAIQEGWRPLAQQQIRGKKQVAKGGDDDEYVRLIKDVKGFGKAGSIVPVSRGQMRNRWLPQRIAIYLTKERIKQLRARGERMERDHEFGRAPKVDLDAANVVLPITATQPKKASPRIESIIISPSRALELLHIFLPPTLTLRRKPLPPTTTPSLAPINTSPNAHLAPAARVPIYGSITPADVAVAVKAHLATNPEASRVAVGEADVRFAFADRAPDQLTEEEREKGRIRHLGEYEFEVVVKDEAGKEQVVRRTLRVLEE